MRPGPRFARHIPVWVKARQSLLEVLGVVDIEEMARQVRALGASQAGKLQKLLIYKYAKPSNQNSA
jgi:hypothetical protein